MLFRSPQSDAAVCWICLDGARPDAPLSHACACPRWTHSACLARWQLQSAGTKRETLCEFCAKELPPWKDALTPGTGADAPAVMVRKGRSGGRGGGRRGARARRPFDPSDPLPLPPQNVNYGGATYSFHVKPGPEG